MGTIEVMRTEGLIYTQKKIIFEHPVNGKKIIIDAPVRDTKIWNAAK